MTPPDLPTAHDAPTAARRCILLVDDDPDVVEVITGYLHRADYTSIVASDGPTGMALFHRARPDLIVLDVGLPGLDGIRFCEQVRAATSTPVIMLTGRAEEEDRLLGLIAGADDYLTKPFSGRELVLRIRAVLRRTEASSAPAPVAPVAPGLTAGDLVVNESSRVVSKHGRPLTLTNREFDLLVFLLRNPGRVLRRDELMREVWDYDFGDASTVTVHMRRLREKIENDPSHPAMLMTVWGVGYRFDPPGTAR
ncbi:response regulator transcription factor [Saccharopolyspora sp. NFXS83]|uniref:response regulator transcription factor n=1 Tax=Saccharopolyspora sp. NFXS83 TaxID=2993560 RepID=UPI00224B3599|nr:response regulator transcription factor [Saccharopolyspora sp. NFXS83]MCX2730117.1 response regulator transcription factor [Saccharopolyspora sp. NFXS83]